MGRTRDDKLAKRSDAHKVEGKRTLGRLIMRWEVCVKRVFEKWDENGESQQKKKFLETIDSIQFNMIYSNNIQQTL